MGFFQDAHAANINGGDFSDVHGDQNNHNYGNSFQMHGQNNSPTIVNGEYYNGPKSSISNQAGGDIHVYGQGDGCTVMMGPVGFPFSVNQPRLSQRTPSPSGPPLQTTYGQNSAHSPVTSNTGYNQGRNDGIINNAGSMQVIGQGQNTNVHIGYNGPSLHPYMPPNNGMYPHYQGYNSAYWNTPQPPSPLPIQYGAPFQHEIRSQPSPYSMDHTDFSIKSRPSFPQQAPTPPNELSPPRPYQRSPSPMEFHTTNYPSASNSYMQDGVSSNTMVGSNPSGSPTSSVVDAGKSHTPGAYTHAYPIPSPSLEPVMPVPLAHLIPASASAPVTELPPASPAFQNVPAVNVPSSVSVLSHAQISNVPLEHQPQTFPLPQAGLSSASVAESGGPLQVESVTDLIRSILILSHAILVLLWSDFFTPYMYQYSHAYSFTSAILTQPVLYLVTSGSSYVYK